MGKSKLHYVCQECGYASPRLLGRCPQCESWNSLVEEPIEREKRKVGRTPSKYLPIPITHIEKGKEERIATGIGELDRVLGGGFVPGSLVLIGGDPGVGKSTLALEMLNRVGRKRKSALYVSAEESPEQVKIRAERTRVTSQRLFVLPETLVENILEETAKVTPTATVIDSIQTIYTEELPSAPGSVGQIRECAAKIMRYAKLSGVAIFLIGHVTKEGIIAGPKVLEHLVDTVLYFEGVRENPYRILRAVKNRFGSTNEIGVFEMRESGLYEIENPSELFLLERPLGASGSVVVPSIEGSRPILVEIQALVSSCTFGVPRRTTIGIDHNRVSLLAAVLEKRAGINILGQDIFMNVAGGVRIEEPAIDLGIAVAMVSSFLNKSLSSDTILFGEVGLAGEIRGVSQSELRLKEGEKLGFKRCILPKASLERLKNSIKTDIILIGVASIDKVLEEIF